ncbi:ABC transporter ATP-binding protein [Leucobacter sp. UCMA 4100]|uniref:ABC transporter ATP-binding protein n=1 Tax=Leucobacter sp. UCMA 4100 TaxID=2810534 RepID=UPI0022EB330A|nr:ABC transporter ATP-binding protein [Leucobacter sp. UCMA 4100]MDA3146484.1 ABC transporter ATP-binding protein [Leucobacter sp. UCMA 4100]
MSAHAKPPAAVHVRALEKHYGERTAVDGIDLTVAEGQVFGLLGPNGAGKTTTVEMLAGLRSPTAGTVRVLGLDPVAQRDELTKRVSVQPQAANLFPTLTTRETLALFASFYDGSRPLEEVIAITGLNDCLGTRVKKLSGGQLRRLLIGIAIIGRPQLTILDEPSAGLDPAARRELWALIRGLRDEGVTVILVSHHMDEAFELCDTLAIMVSGKVVAEGTPEKLIEQHGSRSTVHFTVPEATDRAVITELAGEAPFTVDQVPDALRISIETANPDALLRRVTFHRGLHASAMRVEAPSLEDVFMRLAGEREAGWTPSS